MSRIFKVKLTAKNDAMEKQMHDIFLREEFPRFKSIFIFTRYLSRAWYYHSLWRPSTTIVVSTKQKVFEPRSVLEKRSLSSTLPVDHVLSRK